MPDNSISERLITVTGCIAPVGTLEMKLDTEWPGPVPWTGTAAANSKTDASRPRVRPEYFLGVRIARITQLCHDP